MNTYTKSLQEELNESGQLAIFEIEAMTANFDSAIVNQATLTQTLDEASEALSKYPRGEMGLTPDHIKRTSEWQADKRAFENAMRNLGEFNSVFLRKHKKEYRQHVAKRRAAKLQTV